MDSCTGGGGRDLHAFRTVQDSLAGSGRDVIKDFVPGQDVIDVSDIDADSTVPGQQTFRWVGKATLTGAAQLGYYVSGGNTIVRASTDAEARQLADDAIARVGLSEIAERIAGELTTKELRLMELARALAGQPRILLLDETLAGLGHDEANEVVAVIQRLARDGMTIAIIEHTMQAMVRLVDSFLVLDHGAVIVEGEPEAVTRDSRVIEAYLGKKWVAHAPH